jgi:hypothetical protein
VSLSIALRMLKTRLQTVQTVLRAVASLLVVLEVVEIQLSVVLDSKVASAVVAAAKGASTPTGGTHRAHMLVASSCSLRYSFRTAVNLLAWSDGSTCVNEGRGRGRNALLREAALPSR